MKLYQDEFASPVGIVYVITDGVNLRAVDFEGYEARMHRLLTLHYGQFEIQSANDPGGMVSRLKEYFAGNLAVLDGIPVATEGTPFRKEVWAALRTIPAGSTVSYKTIACRIGRPSACRAVGLANGSNPIAIVVPCHRVVGADKGLIGYGGGIERKRWLLDHEGAVLTATASKLAPNETAKSGEFVTAG